MDKETLARKNRSVWLDLTTMAYRTWFGYRSYPIGSVVTNEYHLVESDSPLARGFDVFQRIA